MAITAWSAKVLRTADLLSVKVPGYDPACPDGPDGASIAEQWSGQQSSDPGDIADVLSEFSILVSRPVCGLPCNQELHVPLRILWLDASGNIRAMASRVRRYITLGN